MQNTGFSVADSSPHELQESSICRKLQRDDLESVKGHRFGFDHMPLLNLRARWQPNE